MRSVGQTEIEQVIRAAVFIAARVSGLMVFAPFFGGSAMPLRVKVGLTVALTALLYPVCGPARMQASALGWGEVMIGEWVIGLLLGLSVQFVMEATQMAGQILGVQMGFSLVNILDPQTQVDTPVLSLFYQVITLLLFLQMNVHHWLLRGVVRSFGYLPAGNAGVTLASVGLLLQAAGGILLVGVQIAAPALAATLVADVMLGFVGKASPQLPVLFIGLSVKSVLGLVVGIAAVAAWPHVLEKHFAQAVWLGEQLLHLAR